MRDTIIPLSRRERGMQGGEFIKGRKEQNGEFFTRLIRISSETNLETNTQRMHSFLDRRYYFFYIKYGVLQRHVSDVFYLSGARVAELADAPDLGSGGLGPWGFKSPLSHHFQGSPRVGVT